MMPSNPTSPTDRAREEPQRPAAALFVGSALWLDFVNTRYVVRGQPMDVLQGFEALVGWLAEAGVLQADAARDAIARWSDTPGGARVLAEALSLRDALRELAEALASAPDADAARPAEPGDAVATAVSALNRVLRVHVCYPELVHEPAGAHFTRLLRPTDDDPMRLLAPVAQSASEVLCGEADPSLVRRCGNPKCVLYFYDTTKNRHRRFCSAAGCGNRMKAAARYRRAKESGRTSSDD